MTLYFREKKWFFIKIQRISGKIHVTAHTGRRMLCWFKRIGLDKNGEGGK